MGKLKVEVTELGGEPFIVEPNTVVMHGDNTISRVVTGTHKYKDDTCSFRLIVPQIAELEAENARLRVAARAVLDTEYYLAGPELAALAALLEEK